MPRTGRMPRMGILCAVAVAVASAFAVSGPAGASHIAGQPDPYFTCQASTARVTLLNGDPIPPVDPLGANLEREECAEDTGGLPFIALPPPPAPNPLLETTTAQARTQILCATDDPDPLVTPENNEACDAGRQSFEQQVLSTADVTDTTVRLGPLTIVVTAANTEARARCGPGNVPVLSSDSRVLGLSIGGSPVPVPDLLITGDPNQVIEIPGLLRITLNELLGTPGAFAGNAESATFPDNAAEGFVTRRAVHLEVLPGLSAIAPGNAADVVVSESTADFHGDVCPEGRIVVKKETAPDESPNATNFDFASPGLTPASFQLMDDGTRTFDEVQPGTFTITEGPPTGDYVLTAINCAENRTDNSTTAVGTRSASINVGPGETVTCTFINAKPPPGVCPTGSTQNQQGQCVITNVTCPAGSTGPNQQGQCIVNTTTCPPGSTRPDPNGPCVVTTPICPAGSTANAQGQCVIDVPNCPPGSTRPNPTGPCVVTTPTCPPGSTASGNQCINNTISCPPGSTNVGNQCVVDRPNCPAGSARNPQGQCVVQNVQCPTGTVFNPTTLGCAEGPRGGTLVPIDQRFRFFFPASPCVRGGFGPLVGIVGTNGPDRITGTNSSDRIFALAGDDRVSGGRGDDCVEGGAGRDVVDGSNGNDFLLGGSSNDRMEGGPGNDRFAGNSGRDVLSGGQGNDRMNGDAGNDRLNGGFGNDVIRGGPGNDGISNGNGRDRVTGGTGNDTINVAIVGPAARVDCGPGRDRVRITPGRRGGPLRDRFRRCEFVYIARRTTVPRR